MAFFSRSSLLVDDGVGVSSVVGGDAAGQLMLWLVLIRMARSMGAWLLVDEGASTRTTAVPFSVNSREYQKDRRVHGNAHSDFLGRSHDLGLHSHSRIGRKLMSETTSLIFHCYYLRIEIFVAVGFFL
jgi:hypothetical protein